MKEIVEILERTNKIYDEKLEQAIKLLEKTGVDDNSFDALINRISSLIGLKIQKVQFINEYEMSKNANIEEVK